MRTAKILSTLAALTIFGCAQSSSLENTVEGNVVHSSESVTASGVEAFLGSEEVGARIDASFGSLGGDITQREEYFLGEPVGIILASKTHEFAPLAPTYDVLVLQPVIASTPFARIIEGQRPLVGAVVEVDLSRGTSSVQRILTDDEVATVTGLTSPAVPF